MQNSKLQSSDDISSVTEMHRSNPRRFVFPGRITVFLALVAAIMISRWISAAPDNRASTSDNSSVVAVTSSAAMPRIIPRGASHTPDNSSSAQYQSRLPQGASPSPSPARQRSSIRLPTLTAPRPVVTQTVNDDLPQQQQFQIPSTGGHLNNGVAHNPVRRATADPGTGGLTPTSVLGIDLDRRGPLPPVSTRMTTAQTVSYQFDSNSGLLIPSAGSESVTPNRGWASPVDGSMGNSVNGRSRLAMSTPQGTVNAQANYGNQPPVPQVPQIPNAQFVPQPPPGAVGSQGIPPLSPQASMPMKTVPQVRGHSVFRHGPGTSGFRATIERDAAPWLSPYDARVDVGPSTSPANGLLPTIPELPTSFKPWWDNAVRSTAGFADRSVSVDVASLVQDALQHSPQVLALQAEPEIQHRVVVQESARFDWVHFLEATYDDLNDPVGNTLTTGGSDRFKVKKFSAEAGLRRRNLQGGELTVSEGIGLENQNSDFFLPRQQGTSRLELNYRQPLLNGSGRIYNESEIVLARIAANASEDDVVEALQDHLIQVTEAFWGLYLARAEFFQRRRLLDSAQKVLTTLEGRDQVDTIPRQVLRARAAVARAQSRIQRTYARVRDNESQLRLLVNSPEMLHGGPAELTPVETPTLVTDRSPLGDTLHSALLNRPDISEAIRRMRAAGVRLGVSRNELLPNLDLIVTSYVTDLEGRYDVPRALADQLNDNRPGFTFGFEYEIPLGNRAARARLEQRQWELKRAISVFRATVEKSLTDVEIADREVATSWSEIQSRFQAMVAAQNEASYLQDRFEVLPMAEDSATLLLEDLLDAYERLADEESSFAKAQVDHAIALVRKKKELGILLRSRHQAPEISSADRQWIADRVDGNPALLNHRMVPDIPELGSFDAVRSGDGMQKPGTSAVSTRWSHHATDSLSKPNRTGQRVPNY